MSFVDRLLGREQRDNPLEVPSREITGDLLVSMGFGDGPGDAGIHVSVESAYRMTAVYRAVALLSGVMGALPLHAYQRRDGSREGLRTVLDTPNPDLTAFELWENVGQQLLTWGNAYLRKVRDGSARVVELWPMHPAGIRVERRTEWQHDLNRSGKRVFYKEGTEERYLEPGWFGDVLHIPGLSYDGTTGMSPLQLAKQGIGTAMAAERFGARMFGRGALIPGVLQTEQKLTKESADRLQASWAAKTSGDGGQWRIPVLDAGSKFNPIALPPAEAQYIETRKFSVVEIARLFGLPPHLLADVERSTSWGSGIEQQNMQMLTFTLDPWLVRIEQRVSAELLGTGRYAKFNRSALLRADTATRYMAYQRAINNGWQNADEIRALEDWDPIPGGAGQTFYRPSNLEDVGGDASVEDDSNVGT